MHRYKSLYKENFANLSPREHKVTNRTLLNASRVQKRNELVMRGRNISLSPSQIEPSLPLKTITNDEELSNKSIKTDAAPPALEGILTENQSDKKTGPAVSKPTRKELYLKRFIEWKYSQRNGDCTKPPGRPFIPSGSTASKNALVSGTSDSKTKQKSALKTSTANNISTNGRDKTLPKRGSIYMSKDTPTKKNKPGDSLSRTVFSVKNHLPLHCKTEEPLQNLKQEASEGQCAAMASLGDKCIPKGTALGKSTKDIIARPQETKNPSKVNSRGNVQTKLIRTEPTKPSRLMNSQKPRKIEEAIPCAATSSMSKQTLKGIKSEKAREQNVKQTVGRKPTTAISRESVQSKLTRTEPSKPICDLSAPKSKKTDQIIKKKVTYPVKPKTLTSSAMQPPVSAKQPPFASKCKPMNPPVNIPSRCGGAVGKFKQLRQKRVNTAEAAVKVKGLPPVAKKAPPNLQLNGTNLVSSPPLIETPICTVTTTLSTQTLAFVTSTHVKPATGVASSTMSEFSEIASEISPVEMLSSIEQSQKRTISLSTSAKRTLLLPDRSPDKVPATECKQNENVMPEGIGNLSPKTEPVPLAARLEDEEPPLLYLSPFVSVSRGKVNRRTEEFRRSSVYLPSNTEDTPKKQINCAEELAIHSKPHTPPEVRRTLEAVRYFRKQLEDEIERLHGICDRWDAYKSENLTRLEETNGTDMIDVAIGQTKLLTSKKFMQFRGLIDRCEANARGQCVTSDGSEDTKPINAIDLEGFWAMVWLQVENLEKRFENLERWKANNWSDPDEVKQAPIKKNLTKVKKVKRNTAANNAKPNDKLRTMLLGLIKERRKVKQAQPEEVHEPIDMVTIAEPVKPEVDNTISGTPERRKSRRISVVVQDRRMYSVARTIVSVPTPPKHRLSITCNQSSIGSPMVNISLSGRRSNDSKCAKKEKESLRNKILNKIKAYNQTESKLAQVERTPSPQKIVPKSALKTPGTAKSNKNVVFNKTLSVRKFALNGDDKENYNDELVEDSADNKDVDRMYCLRNRKVVLRPSSEFVIP